MAHNNAFLKRVLRRLPSSDVRSFHFEKWDVPGQPTMEGFGLLPVDHVDPEALIASVMDVDNYTGNIDHVEESRSVSDSRFEPPEKVRFYQKISIPVLGSIQMESVLIDAGEIEGFRVAYWEMLDQETEALNKRQGIRSQYNNGAWMVKPGFVGYALSSAPRRDDVGFIKWKALTKGADVGASSVIRNNIEGMVRFSKQRS